MEKFSILKNFLKRIHTYAITAIGIEVICTILIGLSSSQVDKFLSPWTILLFFSATILIVILFYKFHYLKDFPPILVDTIKNEFSKQTLENEYSRISLINNSISGSLYSLNSQTCQLEFQAKGFADLIEDEPVENKLCDKGLVEGLKGLLEGFLQNIHLIMESNQSKFTVGIFIDGFNEIPKEDNDIPIYDYDHINKRGTFVLKDDLKLANKISFDIHEKPDAKNIELEIQSLIKSCTNNQRSQISSPMREDDRYSFYANNIPLVCSEDYSCGVLFIIGDNLSNIPNDFDEVTLIHNRIISNWINKYNECISTKISREQ